MCMYKDDIRTRFEYLTPYGTSFVPNNSEIVLGTSVWQYWWWSFFSLFLVLYFMFMINALGSKSRKSISTPPQSYGRIGDLVAGSVPIFLVRLDFGQLKPILISFRLKDL